MDISKRARHLRRLLDKEAASPIPPIPSPPHSELFPKLKGINKPPVLTSSSQPAIDLNKTELPTLPKMRTTGSKPKFTAEMKSANPYSKR